MTSVPRTFGTRDLAVAGLGLVALITACSIPVPTEADGELEGQVAESEIVTPEEASALLDGPTFTPYDTPPNLSNGDEIVALMESEYPPMFRDAGIGGRTRIFLYIDEEGTLRDARIAESSGAPAIDEAALRVARSMRFSPAQRRGADVAVWVNLPFTFSAPENGPEATEGPAAPQRDGRDTDTGSERPAPPVRR